MARVHNYQMSYSEASAKLGSRDSVRLPGTATSLVKMSCGTIGVRYHSTIVVGIYPDDTYSLHTGGYHTVTTARKIREYTAARLYQKDFGWYLASGGDWTDVYDFREGIRIDRAGVVV